MSEPSQDSAPPNNKTGNGFKPKSSFRSRRKLARFWKVLNCPFVVTVLGGLFIFLISNSVQNHYQKSQLSFLIEQSRRANKLTSLYATQEEIIKELGRRFEGIAVVVGSHRSQLEKKQHNDTIEISNQSKREWDNQVEVLNMKLNAYFADKTILKAWESIKDELDTFDQTVTDFDAKFTTSGKCLTCPGHATLLSNKRAAKEHEEAVDSAERTIGQIEGHLNAFALSMNDFINRAER